MLKKICDHGNITIYLICVQGFLMLLQCQAFSLLHYSNETDMRNTVLPKYLLKVTQKCYTSNFTLQFHTSHPFVLEAKAATVALQGHTFL